MNNLQQLLEREVFRFFGEICALPHGSGNTKAVSDYLETFAKQRNFRYIRDEVGNVVIFKDGKKEAEPVILQAHIDMVCVKNPGVTHDFTTDALTLKTDGQTLFADGTTLGADDGIGVAMILEILSDEKSSFPPIEAVFTVDEETSMVGANALDTSVLNGKRMLNLDSELTGIYWVSCAGGVRAETKLPMAKEPCEGKIISAKLSGLLGGHSGTEIDKGRTNAIRLLAKLLSVDETLRLVRFEGGKVDNAIPNFCNAVFCGNAEAVQEAFDAVKSDLITSEPNIQLEITPYESCESAYTAESTAQFLRLVEEMPDGVCSMSTHFDGLVETSLNLGRCGIENDVAVLHWAVRSNVDEKKDSLLSRMQTIAENFGAEFSTSGAYPAWEYKEDSVLRGVVEQANKRVFGTTPSFEAIHAGLECGIFSGNIPGLDCISMGPTIHDIHTPMERLEIEGTDQTFRVLKSILELL